MKIIHRYILKEHFGPFVFAFSALTSLLLLQYIARKFGDLVGRGLSWQVITEFLLLSVPFTVEMTLPMSVLVAVLYAFSRLASENEVTALKAGGVSTRSLMWPAVWWGAALALVMVWFNDQVESRANHELATLSTAILRTKPTFALRPQVLNTIKEGQLYLRAGTIDQSSDHLHDVTIYDVSDPQKRRTIYADSGILAFAPNRRDLKMQLFSGMMLSAPSDRVGQLTRVYYKKDELKVREVANVFQSADADTTSKGDREMSVCEMQKQFELANVRVQIARNDSVMAAWRAADTAGHQTQAPATKPLPPKIGGIGALYCSFITKYLHVGTAQAAEVPQDTSKKKADTTKKKKSAVVPAVPPQRPSSIYVMLGSQYVKVAADKIPPDAYLPGGIPAGADAKRRAAAESASKHGVVPSPGVPKPATPAPTGFGLPGAGAGTPAASPANGAPATGNPAAGGAAAAAAVAAATRPPPPEVADAMNRLDEARRLRNRFAIEIQKKFSLAAACIVFVLVGAPVALRFPRGGVGLVIGVSFFVFAVYYVGLMSGESLANRNIVSPVVAMWIDNAIFLIVGLLLMTRMGKEGVTNRGGRLAEIVENLRHKFTGAPRNR